jgi:hypothetical protein
MFLWADEGSEIVFLYSDVCVRKRTIEKLFRKTLEVRVVARGYWAFCDTPFP